MGINCSNKSPVLELAKIGVASCLLADEHLDNLLLGYLLPDGGYGIILRWPSRQTVTPWRICIMARRSPHLQNKWQA